MAANFKKFLLKISNEEEKKQKASFLISQLVFTIVIIYPEVEVASKLY